MASFNSEIYGIINGESSITSLVEGVYFNHLPDNYKASNDAIVYDSFIDEAFHTVSLENYGDSYTLSVKALSTNPESARTIGQAVKVFLRDLAQTTNIRSIAFQRDVTVYNEEDNIHILNMDFDIDYCNT